MALKNSHGTPSTDSSMTKQGATHMIEMIRVIEYKAEAAVALLQAQNKHPDALQAPS